MDQIEQTAGGPDQTIGVTVVGNTQPLQAELGNATRSGQQFSASLIKAFDGLTAKGKSFNDVLGQLALSLSKMVVQASLKPLESSFSSLISGALGSLGALGDGGGTAAFANGGVLSAGVPTPFADGGVVRSPITFPLGNGQTGLAGERGAEAILPLARGSDGKLGVAASGGGGQTIVFNVSTPDADSFRRSETQVAAMVTRAASLGSRNL